MTKSVSANSTEPDDDIGQIVDGNHSAAALFGVLPADLGSYTRLSLRQQEKIIAQKFHSRAWPYAIIALGGFALWLSFFALGMMGRLHWPLACFASFVVIVAVYLAGHEAMHSNIAQRSDRWRWLNELCGIVSTIPIVLSFSAARITHLEHHRHCNDPERDPDYTDEAPSARAAWYKTWYNRQPGVDGSVHHYKRVLNNLGTPEARRSLVSTLVLQIVYLAVLFSLAWSGYALVAALIWWLPRHLALSWIRFYFSWAPHHPRAGRIDRYETCRIFKSRLGRVLSFETETHLIHHLYPNIPNHRTRAAYFALKPLLERRGVDVSPL